MSNIVADCIRKIVRQYRNAESYAVQVLIALSDNDLAGIWSGFLDRAGCAAQVAVDVPEAINHLRFAQVDALILDLSLPESGAVQIADFACYRQPDMALIGITRAHDPDAADHFSRFPTLCLIQQMPVRLADLLAVTQHCAARSLRAREQAQALRA